MKSLRDFDTYVAELKIQNSDNSIANDQKVDAVERCKEESGNSISLVASNINLVFS